MKFRAFVLFVTAAGIALTGISAQTPAHKPAPKKTVTKKKAAASSRAAASSTKKKAPVRRTAAAPRQLAPTPERYKEIQDALAAKGYLKSPGTGVWDTDSVDALKRYQMDRKEDPTGHITAASLIGLGLGPKTASMTGAPIKPADVPPPPPAPSETVP